MKISPMMLVKVFCLIYPFQLFGIDVGLKSYSQSKLNHCLTMKEQRFGCCKCLYGSMCILELSPWAVEGMAWGGVGTGEFLDNEGRCNREGLFPVVQACPGINCGSVFDPTVDT